MEVESWTGDFDATDDGYICPQYDISHREAIGDEDCLNLNVYTPKLDKVGQRHASAPHRVHHSSVL